VVPIAQAAFEQLSMTTLSTDILDSNCKFNIKAIYYSNVLRNSGLPRLNKTDLITPYSIKLCWPIELYLDLVLYLRAINNNERAIDGYAPMAVTIRDLFAQTKTFTLWVARDHLITMPAELPTAPVITMYTVPMDLEALRTDILVALWEDSARWECGRKWLDGKPCGYGGSGQFQKKLPFKAVRNEGFGKRGDLADSRAPSGLGTLSIGQKGGDRVCKCGVYGCKRGSLCIGNI
jgi:hypothetical protein